MTGGSVVIWKKMITKEGIRCKMHTYVIQLTIILLVLHSIPQECADLITSRDG